MLQTLAPRKALNYNRLFSALIQNLTQTFGKGVTPQFLNGKMETFLTCLALSTYLKHAMLNDVIGKCLEESSLMAIHKTLATNLEVADIQMLLREMPSIIMMPYPVVNDIRRTCIDIIIRLMDQFRNNRMWKEYSELNYVQRLLKSFDA